MQVFICQSKINKVVIEKNNNLMSWTLELKRTNNHFDKYDRITSFWKIKSNQFADVIKD